ncbi:MAG TPA: hypothetical protein VNT25_03600, partial [Allosphingosinicella sp.]|nr:hypothetical protein [Allosphingosinicella sp.]
MGGASLAAIALVLTPALAASSQKSKKQRPAASFLSRGITSFTPAVADPRLAAAFARRGIQPGTFRFTPSSSASADKGKAIRVAVRARSSSPAAVRSAAGAAAAVAAIQP